jgi:osmotically-inducible protein OsmY
MAPGDRSDVMIAERIRARLSWDPEIEGAVIAVEVADGVAMLEGVVRGYQRAAAERIAVETPGVTAVDNRLRLIDPLRPADETIARLVADALAAEASIPAGQIGVAIHDGMVELSGEVNRGAERAAAEAAVVDLPGVVNVRNRITVANVAVPVDQIETTIREAFAAEAAAAAASITAHVNGGQVTLMGTTSTAHYRQLAERAAWGIVGVSEVRNEIALGRM